MKLLSKHCTSFALLVLILLSCQSALAFNTVTQEGNVLTIHVNEDASMLFPMLEQLGILPHDKNTKNTNSSTLEYSEYLSNSLTSGLYVITEMVENDYLRFELNPKYKENNTAPIDTVILKFTNKEQKHSSISNPKAQMLHFLAMQGDTYFIDMSFFSLLSSNCESKKYISSPKLAMQSSRLVSFSLDKDNASLFYTLGIVRGAGVSDDAIESHYSYSTQMLLAVAHYNFSKIQASRSNSNVANSINFIEQATTHLKA